MNNTYHIVQCQLEMKLDHKSQKLRQLEKKLNIGYSKQALEVKFSEKESLLQDLASSIETILFTREEDAKKEKANKEEGKGSVKKVVRDDKEEVLLGRRRRTRGRSDETFDDLDAREKSMQRVLDIVQHVLKVICLKLYS